MTERRRLFPKRVCGFTLIELLIVVSIIAILAAIAVPNFLEAQVRAKVSRAMADQRSLATAVESYASDNNKYPIRHDNWDTGAAQQLAPPFVEKIYDPDFPEAAVGLHVITTPIAYMSSLPMDPFNQPALKLAAPGNPYSAALDFWDPEQTDSWLAVLNGLRVNGKGKGWMMVSVGPDQNLGLLHGNPGGYPPEPGEFMLTVKYIYDPTNGTVSAGNVYRFSGQLGQADILWR